MSKMNGLYDFVTDGQSLVDCWMIDTKDGFRNFKNTNIYLSVSNLFYAQTYYAEVLKVVSIQGKDVLKDFEKDHVILDMLLFNDSLDNYLKKFIEDKRIFSDRIIIDEEQNLSIILYKGLDIDCDDIEELSPVITETIGLIGFYKQRNDNIDLFTSFDALISFVNEFNIECNLKIIRLE